MSSRVQKGKTVFRPVVKGRGRPASTTPAAESSPSVGPSDSNRPDASRSSIAGPLPYSAQPMSSTQGPSVVEEEPHRASSKPPLPTPPTTQPVAGLRPSGAPSGNLPNLEQTRPICAVPVKPAIPGTSVIPTIITPSRDPVTAVQPSLAFTTPRETQSTRHVPTLQPQSTLAQRTNPVQSSQPRLQDVRESTFDNLQQYFHPDGQINFPPFSDYTPPPRGSTSNPTLPYAPLTPLPTQGDHSSYAPAPYFPHLAFGAPDLGPPAGPPQVHIISEDTTGSAPKPRKRVSRKGKERVGDVVGAEGEDGMTMGVKRRGRSSAPRSENPGLVSSTSDANHAANSKRKRRSRATTRGPSSGNEASSPSTSPIRQRKRRTSSSSSRKPGRRKRVPTPPPFDGVAEGEEPDPTTTTMADLCEDLGIGRISSKAAQIVANHSVWKTTSREKREQIKAKIEAKKYGREDDDMPLKKDEQLETTTDKEPAFPTLEETSTAQDAVLVSEDDTPGVISEGEKDGFNYAEAVGTSKYNVQVRIGPNGEMIVDEQSLFVDRPDEEAETQEYTHVEESDATKFVNSASYSKKARGSRWSAEETELFYNALSQFGENYELISLVLPGRDRKACKAKFKAEDKKHSARITYCLTNRTPYDIDTLARLTGKDFSGPTPVIKARPPPMLVEPNPEDGEQDSMAKPAEPTAKTKRKKSRTPAISDGEEILGTADNFIDNDD